MTSRAARLWTTVFTVTTLATTAHTQPHTADAAEIDAQGNDVHDVTVAYAHNESADADVDAHAAYTQLHRDTHDAFIAAFDHIEAHRHDVAHGEVALAALHDTPPAHGDDAAAIALQSARITQALKLRELEHNAQALHHAQQFWAHGPIHA